jgi:hypothetical protein
MIDAQTIWYLSGLVTAVLGLLGLIFKRDL